MIAIRSDYNLQPFHTFAVESQARYFADFHSLEELKSLLQKFPEMPKLILGGGSNVLFTQDFEGLVLRNQILGIQKTQEDQNHVWLRVGAGENWHEFVLYCLERNYAGIENLSLIPGTVGAAPMQNIGAYGVEIKEVIASVEAFSLSNHQIKTFSKAECAFGYRESIFKHEAKDQYVITHVNLRLNKYPTFNTSYGAIQQTLEEMQVKELSIRAISQAVCQIRQSKLPDPKEIGNAGSFFKNPEIPIKQFEALQEQFPDIVSYPVNENLIKVPAGWLIDRAGWKGQRFGQIGVHPQQALVLVNYGGGSGQAILALSQKIQQSILEKFGISLQREINVY